MPGHIVRAFFAVPEKMWKIFWALATFWKHRPSIPANGARLQTTVGKDERSFISREEYDALLAENAELNKKLDYLMGQLRLLKQKTFGVSSVTARADLDALAESGKLRRTHGGAVSLQKRLTVSTQDRRINVNVAAKQAIAQSAIELVNDGDTLLVDSGTTALEFVRLLDQRDGITVITADITIADYIDESMPSVDVVMLGGALRKGHRYLYGPLTMQALQMVHADLAVMCPGAFVPGCGFTTDFPQMAETKAAMVGAARQSVALMDASKVNGRGMYRFAELADVDTIVMDRDPDDAVATSLAETVDDAHPNLVIAGA